MYAKVVFGLLIIFLGVSFLLERVLGVNLLNTLADYWPVILILIGLYQLIDQRQSNIGGSILASLGVIFLLITLDVLTWSIFGYIWPILLIVIGFWIILPSKRPKVSRENKSEVEYFSLFSGTQDKIISQNFVGGNIMSIFGGNELDFRKAEMKGSKAILEAVAIFGGVDITVPSHWKVEINGLPLFGGWDNKTHFEPKEGKNEARNDDEKIYKAEEKILKIKATAIFGGIDIKN